MSESAPAYSDVRTLVYELVGLVGPQRTIAMLVVLLEEIAASGVLPWGFELEIDGTRARGEELVLIDIAASLANPNV